MLEFTVGFQIWFCPMEDESRCLQLACLCPDNAQRIIKLPPRPSPDRKDKLLWCCTKTRKFAFKGMYNHLFSVKDQRSIPNVDWKLWWKLKCILVILCSDGKLCMTASLLKMFLGDPSRLILLCVWLAMQQRNQLSTCLITVMSLDY